MTTYIPRQSSFFARALGAFSILGPIVLVVVAGMLPVGARGALVVNGLMFVVAVVAVALALRGVYEMGFGHARKLLDASPNRSLTA